MKINRREERSHAQRPTEFDTRHNVRPGSGRSASQTGPRGRSPVPLPDTSPEQPEVAHAAQSLEPYRTFRSHRPSLPVTGGGDVPARRILDLQAHPNPFNPATTIRYAVPQSGNVSVSVYDVSGRLVETLIESAYRKAGDHELEYHPVVASGVYFVRLVHGGRETMSRIVLLK